jgi:transcriptional regulator with XRE-family HTH domain
MDRGDERAEPAEGDGLPELPLLPGFREMALRRMSAERHRLVAELTAQRRSAGLSQTEVAARMGTSQSAVARLETGDADVRVSTLERYAAAIGSQLAWQAQASQAELGHPGPGQPGHAELGVSQAGLGQPAAGQPGLSQPWPGQAGHAELGVSQPEVDQHGPGQPGAGQEGQR